jgi:predicted MPP superfamily phosphohydrolase
MIKRIDMKLALLFLLPFFANVTATNNFDGKDKKRASKDQKIIGPYLQNMTYKSVSVCWATLDGTTTVTDPDGKTKEVNSYTEHETILYGLEPGKKYTYDVFEDGTDRGKGTFTTFPKNAEPFHFVILGDTRSRHEVHQKVVNKIIEQDPLFVINTGDLVAAGNEIADWEKFFDINKKLIRNVPYFTVLGNHEQNSKNYYNFFDLPGNEAYYFFTVGDALFIVLDMDGEYIPTPEYLKGAEREKFWEDISKDYFEKEKKWLENVLELNKSAGYIFVMFHPTWYSVKKSRTEEAAQRRKFWGNIFERYNVTAVLNGHDHYYHHARHCGVDYIVTAGGGAPLYKIDAIQPETVKAISIEHFMSININEKEAVMKAIGLDGNIIEEIKVPRRNSDK